MTMDEIYQALNSANSKVRTLHQELDAFFSALPDPFFILDRSGSFLEVLGGNERSLYNDVTFMKGKHISEVFSPSLSDQVMASIVSCFENQRMVTLEYKLDPEDVLNNPYRVTETRWYEARVTPVKDENGVVTAVVWLVINITEKKSLQFQLQALADTDSLTGAFNRRYINNCFQKEFAHFQRHKTPLSCVLLDIDFFKQINDNYGHDIGDAVLVQLTTLLSENIRKCDVFARYGGEEFVILLPNTELDDAHKVAEHLRGMIEKSALESNNEFVTYTISAGISSARAEDQSYASMVTRADKALYQSKDMGRNKVSLFP